jgi:EpsI family protein
VTQSMARFVAAALVILVAAIFLQTHTRGEVFPPRQSFDSFPEQLGSWTGTDIALSKDVLDVLGPTDYLLRNYRDQETPQAPANLFIAYFRSQRSGDTIHSPKNCLPGAGWTPLEDKRISLSMPGRGSFPVNRYLIAKGDARQIVLYWYWAHDRGVASEYWARFYLVADSIQMNRTDGALVRITTPVYPGETPDAAEQRLLPFAAKVTPLLGEYIPR